MAGKKAIAKTYIVTVINNPEFCGIGAGGAQFALGKASVTNERLASWFRGHDGYTVTEAKAADEAAE